MSSLDKLTIKGFKSIRGLEDFKLGKLNVFIGGNGAGKSNLISFFEMLSSMMVEDGLKKFIAGNANNFLFGGPKETKEIYIHLVLGENGYEFSLAPTQEGHFLINDEKRHYYPHDTTRNFGSGNLNPRLIYDKDNSGLHSLKGASRYTYDAIKSWQIYHFHDTSKTAGMRQYEIIQDKKYLRSDASNIAPFLLHLKNDYSKVYGEILNAIRIVMPYFEDFDMDLDESVGKQKINLTWFQKGSDYPMQPYHLSDGSIRFICLATALLQPKPPSTIIIDEPELGLHPQAISILAELIEVASQNTQVIIATQSPMLIDQFAIEDIIVTNRVDGASTFTRLDTQDFEAWLEDYSVGELWTKNIIPGGQSA
jgi:predicted ATPase